MLVLSKTAVLTSMTINFQGIGRIVPFEKYGDRPPDLGEIISVISSSNLPAQDDLPVIFVNVENLMGVPVDTLKKLRFSLFICVYYRVVLYFKIIAHIFYC